MEKRGSGTPIGQALPALATPQQSVGDMVAMTASIRMSMGVSVVKTLLKKDDMAHIGQTAGQVNLQRPEGVIN